MTDREELIELATLARLSGDIQTELAALERLDSLPAEQVPDISQPDDSIGEDALNVLGEFAASANRSVTELIDFLGPDNVNAVLRLSGLDYQIPTLTDSLEGTGIKGGFMEPGIAREGVQAAAAALPAAAGFAPVQGRNLATARGAIAELLGVGSATPSQLVAQAEEAAIPLMTSDVFQPGTFAGRAAQQTAEKIPIVGTGPVRETQQTMRQEAVDRIANQYGEYSYDAIINSLKTQKNKVKSAAGNVLDSVGAKLDQGGDIPTKNTINTISEVASTLSKPNVIQSSSATDQLDTLLEALQQPQTFTSLKENRTAFREIVEGIDATDRSQLTSRAKSLLKEVEKAMTKDMDAVAREGLAPDEFRKWKKANDVYAGHVKEMTKTRLKSVLDKGDVTPEAVETMLFSQKPSEVELLYKSLTPEGKSNARSAIISKVINDMSKTSAGISPNAFYTRMKKLSPQVEIFFKGDEKKQLNGLLEVLGATKRAQDAAVTTPTGQQLIGGLSAIGLYLNPQAALGVSGTVGGLARLYESAPVRNALIKLGSQSKNSPRYAENLLAAQYALLAAANEERLAAEGQ